MSGLSSLSFSRSYDSQSPYTYLTAALRPLGNRWRHNFETSLTLLSDPNLVLVVRGAGQILQFTPKAGSTTLWSSDADITDTLEKTASGWKYVDGFDAVELYDSTGKLQTRTERNGVVQTYTYDGSGRLASVADSFGHRLSMSYDIKGLLASVTDTNWKQVQYTYNDVGTLTTVTYPDGKTRQYQYTDKTVNGVLQPALLTGLVDENGVLYAQWDYDANGLAILSQHADSGSGPVDKYSLNYTLSASQQIAAVQVTSPLGVSQQYALNGILGVNRPTSETYALDSSKTRTQTFDANGNLASYTDFNGAQTTYSYDLARNLETQRIEAAGTPQARTITTEWHASFRLPTRIAEPKKRTTYIYDTNGNVLSRSEQATNDETGTQGFNATLIGTARSWTYTYNSYGQVLTVDGPRSDVSDQTSYAYDNQGNLTSITNALGHVTTLSNYDANGRVGQVSDANGVVTTYSYDTRGRLTQTKRYASADPTNTQTSTSYQYDGVGNLTLITLPDLSTLSYSYDAAHRLTGIQDSLGNQIRYTLDNAGNRLKEDVTDPSGVLSRRKQQLFDQLGRLQQLIGNAGQSVTYRYDANGNLTQTQDALNRLNQNDYDPLNRLIKQADPLNGITVYGYDGLDQLTSVKDARNLTTQYTLTGLGELTAQQSPDTGLTQYQYNPAGQVIQKTDARNTSSSTSYDALGRITQIQYPDQTISYGWDTAWKGQLAQITDQSGVMQYSYDSLGRIQRVSHTPPANGSTNYPALTSQYVWNSAGQLLQQILPSGQKLDYQYQNGKLLSISRNAQPVVSQITWHPFGGLKSYQTASGQVSSRSQDLDGRTSAIQTPAFSKSYSWDSVDRITGLTDTTPARSQSYGYDALDRLTGSTQNTQTWSYGYDAVGNRTSQIIGSASTSNTYAASSNRLVQKGAQVISYDAAGNQLSDGKVSDSYDGAGRLKQSQVGSTTTAYLYSADGARRQKGNIRYAYDLQHHLIGEYDLSGNPMKEYIWLGDEPVAVLTEFVGTINTTPIPSPTPKPASANAWLMPILNLILD